uniref:Serine/threonine-protein phosphatase n=1 Tax=Panagrellus redivivus TaxID=6233 RepID=A0A7E4WAV6_PANRE
MTKSTRSRRQSRQFASGMSNVSTARADSFSDASSSSEGDGPVTPDMVFIDGLIERLMRAPLKSRVKRSRRAQQFAPEVDVYIKKDDVLRLCCLASDAFLKQSSLVRVPKDMLPATIFGDIHGQFRDLRIAMHTIGEPGEMTYVFLGDYVDRGPQSIEAVCLLLALKIRHPHRVFLLRGNHEDYNTTLIYGFYDECQRKYQDDTEQLVFQNFIHVFNCMPFSALIGEKILCMHGGLSPDLEKLDDINTTIKRPTMVPLHGLATDLVWSDPGACNVGWSQSTRGISFSYDDSVIEQFCLRHKLDFIVRGHQITPEMQGSGYHFTQNGRMVTLFTAYNYLNSGNTGATLQIFPGMKAQFRVFRPIRSKDMPPQAAANNNVYENGGVSNFVNNGRNFFGAFLGQT